MDRPLRHRPPRRATSIAAISGAAILVVLAGAGRAHAQSAEAEALFNEADALMKKGKLAQACEAFEGSNKLEPRAGTMIRLGECREKNGQLASAWSAYKDALTRVKDEKKKQIATAKVSELEPRLSHLTIKVPDAVRVDGLEITRNGVRFDEVLWNHALPVNGGQYTIYARALDHGEWSKTIPIAAEHADVEIEVPKLDYVRKKPIVATPPQNTAKPPHGGVAEDLPAQPEPTDAQTSSFGGKRKAAVVFGVLALGAGITGAVSGRFARSNESHAFELCPDPAYPCMYGDRANDELASARTQATIANVSLIAGGGFLVAAVVLWLLGRPDAPSADLAVVPRAGADSTGLAVGGRF